MMHSNYHRLLRVSAVVFALALVFDSGVLNQSTAVVSKHAQQYVANAIGVGASVQPTELNQLTAELTAQKQALEAREAELTAREIEIGIGAGEPVRSQQYSTYILASILFILLVLIVLNYVLDFLRSRERTISEKTA